MAFYPGQLVVCVKPQGPWKRVDTHEVQEGKDPHCGDVCVIERIGENAWGVYLVLIGYEPCGYNAKWFRPAVKRSTDISIFTSMLNPSNAKETV